MQDDRNFVVYDGTCEPIWHSNTWGAQTELHPSNQWWEQVQFIGGNGGTYGSSLWTHGPIESIETWSGNCALHAIKVTHLDGTSESFGRNDMGGEKSSFQFKEGEVITALSVWGNGMGSRAGAFRFVFV